MSIIGATVRSVANGVIGVAFVQALLCGIGFFVFGVPGTALLSVAAMALGVLQVPVVLVTLPAIIWIWGAKTTTVAIIFTVWEVIGGLSDAVLKPIHLPEDPLAASYAVGGVLQVELTRKQRLLELPDAASRLRAELQLLRRESRLLADGALPPIAPADLGYNPN